MAHERRRAAGGLSLRGARRLQIALHGLRRRNGSSLATTHAVAVTETPASGRDLRLLAVHALGLRVEGLALRLLPVDGHEALEVEGLARGLDALGPRQRPM